LTITVVVGLVFATLLWLDWRYRRTALRLGTIALAIVVWWFAQPNITNAARRASAAPPEARVRVFWGDTLSEYMSGVVVMREYIVQELEAASDFRLMAGGVLVWLACSPTLQRGRATQPGPRGAAHVESRPGTV